MKMPWQSMLYGGDYNPEQWPREVWDEDMRLFDLAHINTATVGVFAWSRLQPAEDQWEFGWMDDLMSLLERRGKQVCLGTATAAVPPWMARQYPDVLRVDFEGRQRQFGMRHNFCPNSPSYRTFAPAIAGKLAQRYKDHPGLVLWHVSNEYGGECYCPRCAAAFRRWLQQRYGSLARLNEVWNTSFWSHVFYDWDEIVPPNMLSEHGNPHNPDQTAFQGLSLDYRRFMSDSLLECYKLERDVLKEHTPDIPVTTNFMEVYKPLDYFRWAPHLDIITWDSYPRAGTDPADTAFNHDLMRGLKDGQSFLLLEQTPSQTNWQAYNALKPPGGMILQSLQAVAHGSDAAMFFQLRRSQAGCEKFHGAVIDHVGHENTRVFAECQKLGQQLAGFGDALLGSELPAEAGVVFDWENWWALDYSSGPSNDIDYVTEVRRYHKGFYDHNIPVAVTSVDADWSQYKVLVAPLLYMVSAATAAKIRQFVADGGIFLTTYLGGVVDEHDRVTLKGYPGELRDVLGIWVEELNVLLPEDEVIFTVNNPSPALQGCHSGRIVYERVHSEGAEPVAAYNNGMFAGTPAVTRHAFGQGQAWYVATSVQPAFVNQWVRDAAATAGVEALGPKQPGVECTLRRSDKGAFLFVLNHNEFPVRVALDSGWSQDLVSGKTVEAEGFTLQARQAAVFSHR